jgi:hypothetical protein
MHWLPTYHHAQTSHDLLPGVGHVGFVVVKLGVFSA